MVVLRSGSFPVRTPPLRIGFLVCLYEAARLELLLPILCIWGMPLEMSQS